MDVSVGDFRYSFRRKIGANSSFPIFTNKDLFDSVDISNIDYSTSNATLSDISYELVINLVPQTIQDTSINYGAFTESVGLSNLFGSESTSPVFENIDSNDDLRSVFDFIPTDASLASYYNTSDIRIS